MQDSKQLLIFEIENDKQASNTINNMPDAKEEEEYDSIYNGLISFSRFYVLMR